MDKKTLYLDNAATTYPKPCLLYTSIKFLSVNLGKLARISDRTPGPILAAQPADVVI